MQPKLLRLNVGSLLACFGINIALSRPAGNQDDWTYGLPPDPHGVSSSLWSHGGATSPGGGHAHPQDHGLTEYYTAETFDPSQYPYDMHFDQDMLDSLMHDLSQTEQILSPAVIASGPQEQGSGRASQHNAQKSNLRRLLPKPARPIGDSVRKDGHDDPQTSKSGGRQSPKLWSNVRNWDQQTLLQFRRHYADMGVVEPELLQRLEWTLPSLRTQSGRNIRYPLQESDTERQTINREIFGGKLRWIDPSTLSPEALGVMKRYALLPSRILPLAHPPHHTIENGGGTINNIRVSVHGGDKDKSRMLDNHVLRHKTFYNFWGVPEGAEPGGKRIVQHYGTGYVEPADLAEVNAHMRRLGAQLARSHV